jgi:hypothetical protein
MDNRKKMAINQTQLYTSIPHPYLKKICDSNKKTPESNEMTSTLVSYLEMAKRKKGIPIKIRSG